ncbi:MAG: tryptophan synthase subunit alpha [Thermoplasmata archaeon]
MSSLEEVFSCLREKRQAAYIPYVCAGDPDRDFTLRLINTLSEAGADIVELGLPFSDPIADGPVIQRAMNRSLAAGFKVRHIFEIIEQARKSGVCCPIILMSYLNPILRYGSERFCQRLSEVGGDGLLVVDMPIEESESLCSAARNCGLSVIQLIAPNSDNERIMHILARASGFVYLASVAGTTGAREKLSQSALAMLRKVYPMTRLPLVLGFGISFPQHVKEAVLAGASGVVEGSKLISIYEENGMANASSLKRIFEHVREMKAMTMS